MSVKCSDDFSCIGLALISVAVLSSNAAFAENPDSGSWHDRSPHVARFVDSNRVRLQYLDWGGQGPTILLLAGLGNTAHIFDDLAPKLGLHFHVLALTRRGFGQSQVTSTGYDLVSRVEDVKGVLDALHVDRVNLVGHSIAGDELTEFAARYPERIGKLVYLDAAYALSTTPKEADRKISEALSNSSMSQPRVSSFQDFVADKRHLLGPGWGPAWEADLRDEYYVNADHLVTS